MIHAGANLNLFNRLGNTALHVGAFNNSLESVRVLLENKADIMRKNCENKTCLDLADDCGY